VYSASTRGVALALLRDVFEANTLSYTIYTTIYKK